MQMNKNRNRREAILGIGSVICGVFIISGQPLIMLSKYKWPLRKFVGVDEDETNQQDQEGFCWI